MATDTDHVAAGEPPEAPPADEVVAAVAARFGVLLGETTPDGALTLEDVFCLGNCALGPSASVNGRVLGRASADRISAAVRDADASRAAGHTSGGTA